MRRIRQYIQLLLIILLASCQSTHQYPAAADALDAAGRKDEAREWFGKCAELDVDEFTDAAERADQ